MVVVVVVVVDLGEFTEEGFYPKRWINAALEGRLPQDPLDRFMGDAEESLRSAADGIADALRRVPLACHDLLRLRDDAVASAVASILSSLRESNLKQLLSTLPAATAPSGFYNTTVGQNGGGDGEVYGLALCRGDVSSPDCNTCLNSAAEYAVAECPRSASNTVWNDTCMLRYSNSSFFGVVDWAQDFAWNLNNVTDVKLFDTRLFSLMNNLTREAAYGSGRPPLFATGQVEYINFTNIYGLVQCTRDLSPADCDGCLTNCVKSIPNCCENRIGGRVFGNNCNIRFESAPFYNSSAIGSTPATPPPPPPPAGSDRSGGRHAAENTTKY
ncbi:cysteine-rich repeat secretory protein 38-like [Ananas comosus]|uniref:Cysteine-rich repeat secretory protein 38-like n=1 Tax=Ananas comosus TaxID=4615 RepID=A0A6P5G0R8_ANACO|nr:cysteine-rich repeat secretory protein 38-like [Ananas comosus]